MIFQPHQLRIARLTFFYVASFTNDVFALSETRRKTGKSKSTSCLTTTTTHSNHVKKQKYHKAAIRSTKPNYKEEKKWLDYFVVKRQDDRQEKNKFYRKSVRNWKEPKFIHHDICVNHFVWVWERPLLRERALVCVCVLKFFFYSIHRSFYSFLSSKEFFFSFSIIFIGAILHLPVWNMVCFSLCSILLFHTIVYKNAIHRYIQSHTHSFLLALFRCTATIQSGCVSDIWNNIYNILKVVCVEPIPITVLKWIEFCLHIVIVACTHTHTYTFNQLFVLYFVCRIVRLHVVLSNYLFDK